MVKNYLLDTNILLINPKSMFGFEDNNVWICGTTLQELDSKKNAPGELGYNAREVCRTLDALRTQGDFISGVKLENGGMFFIEPDGVDEKYLPKGFKIEVPDNRIISSCIHLNKTQLKDSPITLLTNDVSMRVNATICGLNVEGVRNDQVEDSNYTGHVDLDVESDVIDDIFGVGRVTLGNIAKGLFENEFVTLHHGTQSALSIYKNGYLNKVDEKKLFGGVTGLNKMQKYAIYALMAPVEEIPLVILEGPAGTAKTFLSLAAGLSQTYLGQGKNADEYRKILISRPNSGNADPGFGYLPGDLDNKMAPLLASYYDNLEAIFRKNSKTEDKKQIQYQIDDLFENGSMEICPLNFIRGRSLQDSFIICDEAQNATKGLIKDVVTRAGKHSKVIITGDEKQCDAPTLDSRNNGLIYCAEQMKGNPLTAIIRFSENNCVRSPLAEAAIHLMK